MLQQANILLMAAVKAQETLVAECTVSKQTAAQAAAWLTLQNAPARLAEGLNLPGLALHVGAFRALHPCEVDLTAVGGALHGVLQDACQHGLLGHVPVCCSLSQLW